MNTSPKTLLRRLNQPSIFLLGLGIVIAFAALRRVEELPSREDQNEARLIIYVASGTLFVIVLLWKALGRHLSPSKEKFEENKDFIGLYTQIATAVLLIVSLWFTWQGMRSTQKATDKNLVLTDKNLVLAEQTLKNSLAEKKEERYTKALERLGEDTAWERVAGMIVLQRIGEDIATPALPPNATDEEKRAARARAEEEHFDLMKVLTDFVQENAPCSPSCAKKPPVPAEVRQALKTIGARKLTYAFGDAGKFGERKKLNLIATDLRNQQFSENSNFEGVQFNKAHLEGAILSKVKLRGANFEAANLRGAILAGADLTDAFLIDAHLEGADLSGATGVSPFQLGQAYTDEDTRCPEGFTQDAGKCKKTEP